jgi:hypothetical protein
MAESDGVLPVADPRSHFSLLRHLKRVIYFDAKISDCAFQLGVAEKYLDCSDIFGSPLDQRGLRPTHRMGTIWNGVEADGSYPSLIDA